MASCCQSQMTLRYTQDSSQQLFMLASHQPTYKSVVYLVRNGEDMQTRHRHQGASCCEATIGRAVQFRHDVQSEAVWGRVFVAHNVKFANIFQLFTPLKCIKMLLQVSFGPSHELWSWSKKFHLELLEFYMKRWAVLSLLKDSVNRRLFQLQ